VGRVPGICRSRAAHSAAARRGLVRRLARRAGRADARRDIARATIELKHRPDGYNVGINVGRAAGQTIFHLHVHVIPRYEGDVPDPRGGVRHVIPASGKYLLTGAASAVAEADPGDGTVGRGARLVRGGESDPLFAHLVACLDGARTVDLAVAFTLRTGVQLLEEHLRDVLDRGGRVRILTAGGRRGWRGCRWTRGSARACW
jgi:hypothetical protein